MFTGDTTSIGIPGAFDNEKRVGFILGPEDEKVVNNLPHGSALLISNNAFYAGSRFLLDEDVITVGRDVEADILLDDPTVSRHHADFIKTENGYKVKDMGSLNGTYLNGETIAEQELTTGDQVQIGKYKLVYFVSKN